MNELNLEAFPKSGNEGDIAAVQQENDLQLALYRRKIDDHNSKLPETGFCHYCGAAIGYGKFCPPEPEDDFSCAADYQAEEEAKKRNGVKL